MKELAFNSIKELREKLEKKIVTRAEVLEATRDRCKKYDSSLGSIVELFVSDTITEGDTSSPLYGVPGLLKDNLCQKDRAATCCSKILDGHVATYDSTVAERLKKAGADLIGRASCDEFAMGSSNETSVYGRVANPWNLSCVPGGSSGGSAAAVAAGLVPWALGTDTGGSVRQPASFCGIVGSKPTYGLVPRHGLIAYASSLDTIGVLTRTVYDNALVMSQIVGADSHDSTARQSVGPVDYTKVLTGSIKSGMKIGVVDNACNAEGIDPEVKALQDFALQELEKLGAEIVHITLPMMNYGAAVYFIISRAEAASNLSRYDGVRYGMRDPEAKNLDELYDMTRNSGFGHEVKRRILIGNYVLSSGHADEYYKSARAVQRMMRQEFLDAFKNVDLLFMPTSPCTAFEFDAYKDDKLKMDLQDYFTAPINLAGIPALSVPCGFASNGLPAGFQLVGPDFSEELLFQTAYAYEQKNKWYEQRPEKFVE